MKVGHGYHRGGSVYLIVLGAAVIVTILGVSALTAARIQRRSAGDSGDLAEARLYARSAIELAALTVNTDTAWRQHLPQGSWVADRPIGRGTYSIQGTDPTDGNFGNNQNDPLLLVGSGRAGLARSNVSVRLIPQPPPGLSCLASAVHAGTAAGNTGSVTVTAPLSCNGNVTNGGSITGNVESSGLVTNWGTISGTVTEGAAAKEMPATTVFDRYTALATTIPLASLLKVSGEYYLQSGVLSSASNPFSGVTNPDGVYLIDCQNNNLVIQYIRIVGTLIVRHAGPNSRTMNGLLWAPARTDYPALMVEGDFAFWHTGGLNEALLNLNFNPPGTPYQGVSDSDKLDLYPNRIQGLCYVSGAASVTGTVALEGCVVVGGTLASNSTLSVTHDSNLINNPPPGFERTNRPMIVDAGTWKPVVN